MSRISSLTWLAAAVIAAALSLVALVLVAHAQVMAARVDDSAQLRFDLPVPGESAGLPAIEGPGDPSRPLVVLDPGHGGFDPGAGQGALKEKNVVLAIALATRAKLLKMGGIRVAMTRDTDRFVSLRERPEIARRLGADLFLSIHADSAPTEDARGATVYVLSEKGTDEAAKRFAATDAQTGRINGVALSRLDDPVGAILLDLSQRGAQARSTRIGDLLLRDLKGKVGLHRDTVQPAALAVLKAPDIPSILFETGYINNPQDAAFLASAKGRDTIAQAIARSIQVYFATRSGP